jgi:hypothetical protein
MQSIRRSRRTIRQATRILQLRRRYWRSELTDEKRMQIFTDIGVEIPIWIWRRVLVVRKEIATLIFEVFFGRD